MTRFRAFLSFSALLAAAIIASLVAVSASGFAGAFGGGSSPAKPIDAEFLTRYSIPDGSVLIRIVPPFPASRRDAYISMDPVARMPGGSSSGWPIIPGGMIVQWTENGPTMKAKTPRMDKAFTVLSLLRELYGPTLEYPKGDRRLLGTDIEGDFVLKAGIKEDDLAVPLGKILSTALARTLTLDIRKETTDVYVLSGTFKYQPLADEIWRQSAPPGIARPKEVDPHFHIYASEIGRQQVLPPGAPRSWNRRLGTSARTPQVLVDLLAEHLNAPVVLEAKEFPARYAYNDYGSVVEEGEAGETQNATLILDHFAQQTGLTWKKEQRELRHVVISEAK